MKYLIVGLGNIGAEYQNTRHNIGFTILDAFAKASNVFFTNNRYGATAEVKIKGRKLILLKPATFMNLSGNAVRYWMEKEKVKADKILIVVDDVAIPFGTLRLKAKGSDAGHNGLKNIQAVLNTQNWARLRFGIGNNYPKGGQIDYVLGEWTKDEQDILPKRTEKACGIITSFCLAGVANTMNEYNNKE